MDIELVVENHIINKGKIDITENLNYQCQFSRWSEHSVVYKVSKKFCKGFWIVKVIYLPKTDKLKQYEYIEDVRKKAKLISSLHCREMIWIRKIKKKKMKMLLYMNAIEGQSLADCLKNKGRFSENEVIKIGIQLCNILQKFHTHKPRIIYRDMKPSNILINTKERIFLIDFETIWIQGRNGIFDKQAVGTKGYAPFEQYIEGMEFSATTDIYALGITLMELLTNERPWEQNSVREWIERWHGCISDRLLLIIKGCTEELMHNRYQSCTEVRKKLQETKKVP